MKLAVTVTALLVAGCNQPTSHQQRQHDEDIVQLRSEIADLREEIRSLKEEVAATGRFTSKVFDYTKSVDNANERLRGTVNHNARIENEEAAKRMTERGACGQISVQASNGQWFQTNKTCTVADLRTSKPEPEAK